LASFFLLSVFSSYSFGLNASLFGFLWSVCSYSFFSSNPPIALGWEFLSCDLFNSLSLPRTSSNPAFRFLEQKSASLHFPVLALNLTSDIDLIFLFPPIFDVRFFSQLSNDVFPPLLCFEPIRGLPLPGLPVPANSVTSKKAFYEISLFFFVPLLAFLRF